MTHLLPEVIPLWLLAFLTPVVASLSVWFGYRLAMRRRLSFGQEPSVSALVQATLGLLAFMLAFTFGMAESHFQVRKELVLEEANAVGTTYLRAGFIAEPQRTKIRRLLTDYAGMRVVAKGHPEVIEEAIATGNALLEQLWAEALIVGAKESTSVLNGLFISSLNDVIDIGAKRVKARLRTRISPVNWAALFIIIVLSMATMGYHTGLSGSRVIFVYFCVIVTFSVVMYLIGDLDLPQEGIINVSQQDMVDLYQQLSTQEAR